MAKQKKKISKKGLPPGSNVYTGQYADQDVSITAYVFNSESFTKNHVKVEDLDLLDQNENKTIWLDIIGVHSSEVIAMISEKLNIHILHQEDVMNIYQRPKVEEEKDYIFVISKMLTPSINLDDINIEQVSFILKDNLLISFQERDGDVFEPIRDRLNKESSKLRNRKSDYLLYALLDVIIDGYLEVLHQTGEDLENMEEDIVLKPGNQTLLDIQQNKKKLLEFKRIIYPMREVLMRLQKMENDLIKNENLNFYLDLYDHSIQAYEMIENYRELNMGLKDLYLNQLSHEMNKIMKVLTIIATLFIPLTFIAGVYGMNFENMPELTWPNGYYYSLAFMALIVIGLLYYFKRKNWL